MNRPYTLTIGLLTITIISGGALASNYASAEDVVDDISIEVPTSCSMSGSGMNTHTAEIANGTYQANIGTTTITALCNDNAGFSIYAAGYTGQTIGQTNSNKLVGTEASSNATIDTGTATTAGNPDVSNWAMKLATDSEASYPLTLSTGYNAYHAVPNEYTNVATRLTGTDTGTGAVGSTLTTTYAAYISKTQAADTYSGKVKYTLVHPNTETPPIVSVCPTPVPNLTYMQDLNSSNKSSILDSMTEDQQYFLKDARDEKTYCVAKLKDGNIWMTQNLDHDIVTDGSVSYNNTTTDLGWNGSGYSTTSWIPIASTHATNNTEWGEYDEYTNPDGGDNQHAESYDPGNLYWSGTPNDSITTSTGNSHYHLGNYYNWTAAIATNDSSGYDSEFNYEIGAFENVDANQSICPAGWTLPKSGEDNSVNASSGSFQYLVSQYGWIDDGSDSKMINPYIWDSPIKLALTGGWDGSLYSVGGGGIYSSSVTPGSDDAFYPTTEYDGRVSPGWYYDARYLGSSIRCLAR